MDSTFATSILPFRTQSASNAVTFEMWLPLEGWNRLFRSLVGGGRASGFHDTPCFGDAVKVGYPLLKSARSVFVRVVLVSSRDLGLGCGGTPELTPDYHDPLSTLASCT